MKNSGHPVKPEPGKQSSFAEEVLAVIHEFGHSTTFPRPVLEEAGQIVSQAPKKELEGRVDLRGEVVVTIDGEKARDFDDAVSVLTLPEGGWRLKVSIADVGYYVPAGSPIDREAYRRATSVYFPDRVLPMLPERLSNDLCSLVPGEDRLTVTAEIDFDPQGRKVHTSFYRSLIRSAARLTYDLVHELLNGTHPSSLSAYRHVPPSLMEMHALYQKLRQTRLGRGSLDFDLPEPEVLLDLEAGKIDAIVKAIRYDSHRMIEEFMIAANEAVAEFLEGRSVSSLYRIHEPPDPEKARDFFALLHNMGIPFVKGRRLSSATFANIINAVRGRPEERFVNTLLLRTMKQATYDPKNKGHFGLASRCYTHFTSPIRRYPDLVVHRVLCGAIGAAPSADRGGNKKQRAQMAEHCSERERNAMKTEWAVRDLAAVHFMGQKIGETYSGIIANVTKFGFFVEIHDYFVQGLVGLRSLTDDYYIFDEHRHLLAGRRTKRKFQIGQRVVVQVEGVNRQRRWLDFSLKELL